MKKSSFAFMILCFHVFMMSSCGSAPVEKPPDNGPPEKSDGNFDEASFKQEIGNGLREIPPRRFFESDIPILEVWDNIGYNTAIYLEFFYNICPMAKRTQTSNELGCNYASGTQSRKFRITRYDNRIVAYIEKFGKPDFYVSALWEILYEDENLSIAKYEKVFRGNARRYAKTFSRYAKQPDGTILIEAEGELGGTSSYSFETNGLRFSDCRDAPSGTVYLYGQNEAALHFYGYKIYECDNCASAKIDGVPNMYSFCGQWFLYDIFGNLLNFLE